MLMKHFVLVGLALSVLGGAVVASCGKDSLKELEFAPSVELSESYDITDGQTVKIPFQVQHASGKELEYTVSSTDPLYETGLQIDSASYAGNVIVSAPEFVLSDSKFEVSLSVKGTGSDTRIAETSYKFEASASSKLQIFTESANSFIVKPGALARINVVKPVSDDALTFDGTSLIWQDAAGLTDSIFVDSQYLYAKFKDGVSGNAVIAATEKNAVVWSWDFWVTDFDPDQNTMSWTYASGDTETTYVFMDRNLGALTNKSGTDAAHGNFYQWGRKDAFAGSAFGDSLKTMYDISGKEVERTLTAVAEVDNTETAIANPLTHYTGVGGGNYSWITVRYSNLDQASIKDYWGGTSRKKTEYDPCPAGWRVPPIGAFTFWNSKSVEFAKAYKDDSSTANDNMVGWNVTIDGKTFFWPDQGEYFNYYNNGVGTTWPCGKVWSASADPENFRGYSSSVSPSSHSYWIGMTFVYELPVRCIKE